MRSYHGAILVIPLYRCSFFKRLRLMFFKTLSHLLRRDTKIRSRDSIEQRNYTAGRAPRNHTRFAQSLYVTLCEIALFGVTL